MKSAFYANSTTATPKVGGYVVLSDGEVGRIVSMGGSYVWTMGRWRRNALPAPAWRPMRRGRGTRRIQTRGRSSS